MKKHYDFLPRKDIFRKRLPNGVPQSDLMLGKYHFGVSGGTSGISVRFFAAKVLQKWSQACKSDSKRHPKVVEVGAR